MSPTGVVVIDHQSVVCESLAAALAVQPDLRVLGHASLGVQVPGVLEDLRPSVVVLEGDFLIHRGVDVLEHTKELTWNPAVVVMLREGDALAASRALRMGAKGFVLTTSPVRDLIDAVRWAAQGQMWASPPILAALLEKPTDERSVAARLQLGRLTRRELEVLQLLVEGLGHADISARLHLSSHTVRTHSQNLQRKLEVRSALGAVSIALAAGLRPAS